MTVAVIAEAVLILAVLVVHRLVIDDVIRGRTEAEERWQAERAELLNRIQRPDILPVRERDGAPPEPADPKHARALAQVGKVVRIHAEKSDDGDGES